jgi:hypothetical protein
MKPHANFIESKNYSARLARTLWQVVDRQPSAFNFSKQRSNSNNSRTD